MRLMKIFFSVILLLTSIGASAGNIIPQPRSMEKRDGTFTILTTTKITHYPSLRPLAQYLAEYLPLDVREYNESVEGNIVLRENKNLDTEGYTLDISERGIIVEGGSSSGVFYGIETLLQLLPSTVYSHSMPMPTLVGACRVEDAPRFEYRGFMLDVSRTWIEKDDVLRFIERLAHHKINKLHLHLSDDEAWRVEILSHPELASVGGFRGVDSPIAARYGEWDEHYGGYYTQEDVREMVEYAALRGIEIIPEIDLPGHSHALARVRPDVLCCYTPSLEASLGYDPRSALCVSKEENYALLEDVVRELAALFPSPYIHIGGDEVLTSQWKQCPSCQALMKREGMTEASQLQDYFTHRMERIVARYGKRIGVWNEAAESGDIDKGALVYGWESVKACREVIDKGYRTVVMPGEYFYFDMRQTAREEGHDWAAIFDVRKTAGFGFEAFSAEQMERVAGVQASFFSEAYISRRDYDYDFLYYQTYPRICALSEVAWRGEAAEWEEFYERLKTGHYSRMEAMGIDFRMMPPKVEYSDGVLSVKADDGSKIYYREVGSDLEHLYRGAIATTSPERFSFRTRRAGARSPEAAVEAHWRTLRPKVKITSSIAQSERYPYTNAEGYGRVARTSRAGREGDWLLYTFDKAVECRQMEVRTGNLQLPRNIFEAGYVEISYDGEHFERVCDLTAGGGIIDNPRRAIKALRIVCSKAGNGEGFVTVQWPTVWPKM